MLTVIVIVAILIATAVPVLTHLSRAGGLNSAVRQVSNSAALARQYAITHRTQVELRITNTWDAVSVYTNVGPTAAQLDKWNYFPPGIIVDPGASTNSVIFTPTGGTTADREMRIVVREGSIVPGTPTTLFGVTSNRAVIAINHILGKISINRPQ